MKAILKVADINSFVTLVNAGEDKINIVNGFPSNQFNHAILCIPVHSDTIWLECTSQHFPAGFLGTFTDDRNVLVVTENGGVIGHTKKYSYFQNIQKRKCDATVLSDGSASVHMSTVYSGIYYDKMQRIIQVDDIDKQKQLEQKIQTTNFKITYFSVIDNHADVPEIIENIDLTLNKLLVQAGNFLIFTPNQFTRSEPLVHSYRKRNTDIWINRGFTQSDTVCFNLPNNFELVQPNAEDSFESKFGKYSFRTSILGNKLYYIRDFVLFEGMYPAESYESLVDFYNKISSADNIKLTVNLR